MRLLVPILLTLAAAAPALAAESTPSVTKRATVALVSDTDAVSPGTPYRLGLHFRLAPGWHTYYRNPGDAGVPAELAWTAPDGTAIGPTQWPTPQRLPEGPLMTFGYTDEVLLTHVATGPGPVRLHASWLVCNNICVPEEADFTLDLPAGTAAPSAQAPLFATAASRLPVASPWPARLAPDGTLSLPGATFLRDAWFLPQAEGVIPAAAPQAFSAASGGAALRLTLAEDAPRNAPVPGLLIATRQDGSVTGYTVTAEPGPPPAGRADGLAQALLFGLLGGLILNLMPCVFPILAMKALAIARLCHGHRGEARQHAAAYTAGVMASFAAIGLGLATLREVGVSVGWGFQFQSPAFVAATAWVLFAVGLSFSGVLEVAGRFTSLGQGLTLRGGLAGSFFAGALATLVATPCTAPFMGVALAYALAAPAAATLAVFLSMGAGLALPTVLVAVVPGLDRIVPRPGPWMETFRQALAFPMYAATAWLVWVLSVQAGSAGVLAAGAGMVLIGFAAWVLRHGRAGRVLAVLSLAGALALLPGLSSSDEPIRAAAAEGPEIAFSPTRLASLRADGKPVFVNMTAAWCVTCLVNEKVALDPAPVQQAFAASGVVQMKGDWTRQDPAISAYLQEQGRDGVPLYVFYPPGQRPPVVLPQLLTQATVLDTLRRYAPEKGATGG